MSFLDDEDKLITAWHTAFERCTDVDLWGQPLEAIDGYQRLILSMQQIIMTLYTKSINFIL